MTTTTNRLVAGLSSAQIHRAGAPLHAVLGSGGSRAILAGAGFIYAWHKSGLNKFQTAGGVSGGSIPSLMYAAGMNPGKIVQLAVDIDFSGMLTPRTNIVRTFIAFLLKERLAQTRPRHAVLGSEKLEQFIDQLVPEWPENYWTMAVAGKTQVVFKKDGVFQYLHDGSMRQISSSPAPLGLAICASCAVPGIIEPKIYQDIYLFDGALSWDGQCPIGVAVRDMHLSPAQVIACDLSERENGGLGDFVNNFWRFFCGRNCVWPLDERDPALWAAQGSLLVNPKVDKFSSLQFTLTAQQKWGAVMAGFGEAVNSFWKAGLIDRDKFVELGMLAQSHDLFMQSCRLDQGGFVV